MLAVCSVGGKDDLTLPSDLYLRALTENDARALLRDTPDTVVRIYGVNKSFTGMKLATRLSVGVYSAVNQDNRRKTFN